MTNQEKRSKSGEVVLGIIQNKLAATVKEVEKQTKLPHEEVVSAFRGLEDAGMGRFIVGRVRFVDKRADEPVFPIDVAIKNVEDDGRIELQFVTDLSHLSELLERIKGTGLAQAKVDVSGDKPAVFLMVPSGEFLGNIIKALRPSNKYLS